MGPLLLAHRAVQPESVAHDVLARAAAGDAGAAAEAAGVIARAYGEGGLGILAVTGVPGVEEARRALLPLAHRLAALPPDALAGVEQPEKQYMFGWSHGKERLQDGRFDTAKGSYYAHPTDDTPFASDPAALASAPTAYAGPNVWPDAHLPELSPAFKALGRLIIDCGAMVAACADAYAAGHGCAGRLARIVTQSPCHKARLLYYFPLEAGAAASGGGSEESSWCGWHLDHGSLTGLVSGMYVGADGAEVPNPDATSGLHIRTRDGEVVRAVFPGPGSLAFQLGECSQVHTGGLLQATPHCVRGAQGPGAVGVARCTYALFMQPRWDEPMDPPPSADKARVAVPAWEPGQDFGAFTKRKVEQYYA